MTIRSIHERIAPRRKRHDEDDMTGEEPCANCGQQLRDHDTVAYNGSDCEERLRNRTVGCAMFSLITIVPLVFLLGVWVERIWG